MADFILSFILPRKMIRHRDMNIFIAVLLFFMCFFLAIGSSNFMGKNYVRKIEQQILLYSELKAITDETQISLPKVTIETTDDGLTVIKYDETIHLTKITHQVIMEDGTIINLIIFFDLEYDYLKADEHPLNFDIEGYLNHVPAENEKDMLYIVTKNHLFYVHNHGKYENGVTYFDQSNTESVYEVDDQGRDIYYLPKDVTELEQLNEFGDIDKSAWSEVVTSETPQENGQYYKLIDGVKYTAVRHLKDNPFNALSNGFIMDYRSSQYYQFPLNGFSGTVKDLASSWYDFVVNVQAEAIKLNNQLFGFLTIFIIPLLFIIVTWLMSRKYSELTRFKEYYVIAAVSLVLPSLISFGLGFFIPYILYSRYFMFAQVGFYMFVIFRINTDKRNIQVAKPVDDEIKLPQRLETSKLPRQSVLDSDNSNTNKPSEIE